MVKIVHCGLSHGYTKRYDLKASKAERDSGFVVIEAYWFSPQCCPKLNKYYWVGVDAQGIKTGLIKIHRDDWPDWQHRIDLERTRKLQLNRLPTLGEYTKMISTPVHVHYHKLSTATH